MSANQKTIMKGLPFGRNLYYMQYDEIMNPKSFKPEVHSFVAALALVNTPTEAFLAHLRLQHASYGVMLSMVKRGTLLISVELLQSSKSTIERCTSCAIGKAHSKPFPAAKGHRTTSSPLEMVHSDLMTGLPGHFSNVMTIIDDFSGYVWAWGLRRKSSTFQTFSDWHSMILTQFPQWKIRTLRTLRTDNGGEFVNSSFQKFCASLGINHELTDPFTPQQNGVAERMNRTIADKVVCALHDSHLPRSWWNFALGAAVWSINRSFNSRELIPWEAMNKRKCSLEGLHPFGCLALAKIVDAKKFSPRASECLMMGYCGTTKVYRLYNLERRTHFISRNVQFFDDQFPGLKLSQSVSETVDLVPLFESFNPTYSTPAHSESSSPPQSEAGNDTLAELPFQDADGIPPGGDDDSNSGRDETSSSSLPSRNQPPTSRLPVASPIRTRSTGKNNLHGQIAKDHGGNVREENYTFLADLFSDEVLTAAFVEMEEYHTTNDESPTEFDCFIAQSTGDLDWPEFVSPEEIPCNYEEAMASPHAKWWKQAMDEQIASLKARGTFEIVDLPSGSVALHGGWVYTVKRHSITNRVLAFKARWVI